MTTEGPTAWHEAIQALREQSTLNKLEWDDGLALAARDHCNDIGPKGLVQHEGSDGTQVWHRIRRYGKAGGTLGENISFGEYESGEEILTALFIDDGVADRGHRNALQNNAYNKTGIAFCDHNSQYKNMISFAYATTFSLSDYGRMQIQK